MEQLLHSGLTQMGLSTEGIPSLIRYADLLVEKNKVMNLTAITEPHDVATLHFLDSVAMLTLADLKGKKMAGQMGNETVTVQNLKVFGTDEAENLIFVEGAVPGANGTFVLVTDAIKKEHKDLPVPTKTVVTETAGTEETATETEAVVE